MADAAVVVDLLGTVEDAMTRPVVRLTEDMIASEAARILERAGASSAPVTTHDGERVVGFITMKDLTARADIHTAAQTGPFHRFEHLLAGVEVGDVMTRDAVVAPADWPLMRAVETMNRRGVHRLPVVDRSQRLVGILTRDDVVRRLARAGARIPLTTRSQLEPD